MQRECDIGSLFSMDTTDVSGAALILEREGIRIIDETGSISLTSDAMKSICVLLQRTCYMNNSRVYIDAVDTILRNQNTITTEDSKANKALDEFLSTFAINKTRSEVS